MFNDINPDTFQTKLNITEAAVESYVDNDGDFTLREVAKKTELDVASIFEYFPHKRAILEFYYASTVIRYHLMLVEIDEFESYTLSEKLSNFIYASFDMLQEREHFVESTFNSVIRNSFSRTDYEKYIEETLEQFFREDKTIATSSRWFTRPMFFQLMRRKYLGLVSFWISDESENKELTMELTDKTTDFIQEVMYSAVVDKGLELMKFLVSNNMIRQNIPFWDNITSTIEIRD